MNRFRLELAAKIAATGGYLALVAGAMLFDLHRADGAAAGGRRWIRDAALTAPAAIAAVAVATIIVRWYLRRGDDRDDSWAAVGWALLGAFLYAAALAPVAAAGHLIGVDGMIASPPARDISAGLLTAFLALGLFGGVVGTPWRARLVGLLMARVGRGCSRRIARRPILHPVPILAGIVFAVVVAPLVAPQSSVAPGAGTSCEPFTAANRVTANVVALDQPFFYNRLGADNPAGLIYALRRDVVVKTGPNAGVSLADIAPTDATGLAGNVQLRSGKRPRPMVLRVAVGDCLRINFQNLLAPTRVDAEQPADRHVGIHVNGMQVAQDISDDGSNVGANAPSGVVAPGEFTNYNLLAEYENTFLISNLGAPTGSQGLGGTTAFGLFGAVNVEPYGTDWYRSQVTRDDMQGAMLGTTPSGQPILNYESLGADGAPILKMRSATGEIVHSDLDAIVAGPATDGYEIPGRAYPKSYWENAIYNGSDPAAKNGSKPFREFTVIFHDEIFARQAFPEFNDPVLRKTLHPVVDGFAINYGTGGIGAEILANRKGVGPMWDCAECKYEEFFLSSWAVGDPAMVVDVPANQTVAAGGPGATPGARATKALYPDDPSNAHHSYLNNRVKFRNLHAGPKEHHIFHLHAHQWQFNWNSKKSAYLDSQGIGPGQGFTYEIAYGGSGNRNKTIGDAIFHCHFYPHFAQGMWELWRVHDTFEMGTALDADGRPAPGSRAAPDGEITSGVPIPGVVPLPGQPLAPMPDAAATVAPYDLNGDGVEDSSQIDVDGNGTADMAERFRNGPATNAGFPFFVPGVAGHRPPSPPKDLLYDGGLPRHVVTSGPNAAPGAVTQFQTRLDFGKVTHVANAQQLPEDGTPAEQKAMGFHAVRNHDTVRVDNAGTANAAAFETNGLPPKRGAPFAEPCRTDSGAPVAQNRTYKGVAIQLDAKFNKQGWHFPQQRILSLAKDVTATLTGKRPPEPLVMRLNAGDCAEYQHTNLVPAVYQLDDFQIRTPTDIIGQHIHLVKFDLLAADGSGNGFNYEDGTLSPDEIRERISAFNAGGFTTEDGSVRTSGANPLTAAAHPEFGATGPNGENWLGARTTIQRWYADPVLNDAWDRGHGSVFTHDHYGPSTHQQVGLYATVLVEPEGSKWRDSETGVALGTRDDGGPTSWRSDIYWPAGDTRAKNSYREFYLEFSDFQQAYQPGKGTLGTIDNGAGVTIPSYASNTSFLDAINPPLKGVLADPARRADLAWFPPICAGGVPRPCPEAIAGDDPGTFVVNYRNEPLGSRVFDPATKTQAVGPKGDLALAFQSRTDRAIPALNSQPTSYPPLTSDVDPGDPYTPILRSYAGDKVRLRLQAGAHEEEHNFTIHGLKWLDEPLNPDSGWKNSKFAGISEYFSFDMPILPDLGPGSPTRLDYVYEAGSSTDDLWNGMWGLLRSYGKQRKDLQTLPNNPIPAKGWTISNQKDFLKQAPCPTSAPMKTFKVTAVRAVDVIGPNGLVFNPRADEVRSPLGVVEGKGPLVDPTALIWVATDNVILDAAGKPSGLKRGTPVEPIVLRANAGDCLRVEVTNKLPSTSPTVNRTDLPGYNSLPPIDRKDLVDGGFVTFNNNDITPSSLVGLHPQLVSFSIRTSNGRADGTNNSDLLVAPGESKIEYWYAGDLTTTQVSSSEIAVTAKPVEFGVVNLMAADPIKGASKGLVGALVIEPPGASAVSDPGSNTQANVAFPEAPGHFRDLVTVLQDDVNMRYAGGCAGDAAVLGCAVTDVGAEDGGIAEDAEDAGQKAMNYKSDPLWFRLGITPDTPFNDPNLNGNAALHDVFSNQLTGGDPAVPIQTAKAGDQVRMRLVQPGGHARGHVMTVNGHSWQQQPSVTTPSGPPSDRLAWTFHQDPTTQNIDPMPGHNMVSWWTDSVFGVSASSHFDVDLRSAGGVRSIPGDYLVRDQASFGQFNGLWSLLRVR